MFERVPIGPVRAARDAASDDFWAARQRRSSWWRATPRSSRHPPRDLGQDVGVEDTVRVRCPYCREWIELYVDPDTTGVLVEDCAVCCRPWTVTVERDAGRMRVHVSRAQ